MDSRPVPEVRSTDAAAPPPGSHAAVIGQPLARRLERPLGDYGEAERDTDAEVIGGSDLDAAATRQREPKDGRRRAKGGQRRADVDADQGAVCQNLPPRKSGTSAVPRSNPPTSRKATPPATTIASATSPAATPSDMPQGRVRTRQASRLRSTIRPSGERVHTTGTLTGDGAIVIRRVGRRHRCAAGTCRCRGGRGWCRHGARRRRSSRRDGSCGRPSP